MGNIADELIEGEVTEEKLLCCCCKKRKADMGNMCVFCDDQWFEAQEMMAEMNKSLDDYEVEG